MTTLVHTCPDGPSRQQIDLLTPTARVARSTVLTLDSSLVDNVSAVAGATVTDALNNLNGSLGPAALQSVIGWAPASLGTQALQLLAAGHPAGMYEISTTIVIRTAATGTALAVTLAFSAPNVGADSKTFFSGATWAVAGTLLQSGGNQAGATRQATIVSDGTAPIALTYQAGLITVGAPVADLYGVAIRIAA